MSLTLTTANGSTDQARPFCLYFIDSSGGTTPCFVTIPAVVRYGLVENTCNHLVALTTTGSAPYLILPANSAPIMYYCDGTNVLPALRPGFVNRSASYSGTFTAPSLLVRFRLWGGGGAAGSTSGTVASAGGGGGGGGYCEFTAVLGASASITAVVGTGGASFSAGTATTVTIPSAGITATAGGGAAGTASSGVPGSGSGGAGGTATLTGASGILSNGLAGASGAAVSISGTVVALGGPGGLNSYGGAPGGAAMSIASFYGGNAAPSGIAAGGSGSATPFIGGTPGAGQLILDW